MSQIKCFCKEPYRGLGRTLYGYFKSQNKLIENHLGVMELHRSDPISVPVYVHPETGVFYLDDIKQNREVLRNTIIKGRVELDDYELQQEIVGVNKVIPSTTIIDHVEKEVVVQKAGVISTEPPKYGKMSVASKPLNEKLEENLAKYRAKKEERQAARELRKAKNKILYEETKQENSEKPNVSEVEEEFSENELSDLLDLNKD